MSFPTPIDVLRYYKSCTEALSALRTSLQLSITSGSVAPSSQFVGMTPEEFNSAMASLQRELEIEVVLMLAASFEALVQRDMLERINRKKKDFLSKAFRKRYSGRSRRLERITMEWLLDEWKKIHRAPAQVIGRMKSLFLYRHWVAHGRYWTEKSGLGDIEPFEAWRIGRDVFAVLPGFAPLPAWQTND